MKKFLKTSFLILAAAMLFAACKQPDDGPASNIEVTEEEFENGNWLTDGIWHMDSTTTHKFSGMGQTQESKSSSHVEMEVDGDDIRIINATQTIDGQGHDITSYMQNRISEKQDALDQGQDIDLDDPSGLNMNFSGLDSAINPDVKFFKSEDGTEYRVTVDMHINYADLMKDIFGSMMSESQLAQYKDINLDSNTEVIYKKQ